MLLILVYSSTISVLTGQVRRWGRFYRTALARGGERRDRVSAAPWPPNPVCCNRTPGRALPAPASAAPSPSLCVRFPAASHTVTGGLELLGSANTCLVLVGTGLAALALTLPTLSTALPPQGFSSIAVDAAKYYDTSEVVINTLVTASNVAQIIVVCPLARHASSPTPPVLALPCPDSFARVIRHWCGR
jgi:hypothetical protein